MSSLSSSELTQAIKKGIFDSTPNTIENLGGLKHTPKFPDLAKIWRSGGAQRNSWIGSLGVLSNHEYLDEALFQAKGKLSEFEFHRMYQSVLDWSTSLFTPVQPPIIPLDPLEKAPVKSLSGPYLAEMNLFALPLRTNTRMADELMADSTFTSLFRKHDVFDNTSTVAFLGRFSLRKALTLSPQALHALTRSLRPEIVRFWETGDARLSPVPSALLKEWLKNDNEPLFSFEEIESEEIFLLGVRFALCHKDGHPHDVLSERRTVSQDQKSLENWHQTSMDYIHKNFSDFCLLSEPCTLGKVGLQALVLAIEGRLSLWANQEHQDKIQKLILTENKEMKTIELQGFTSNQHLSPVLSFPSDLLENHLCGLKQKWRGRMAD